MILFARVFTRKTNIFKFNGCVERGKSIYFSMELGQRVRRTNVRWFPVAYFVPAGWNNVVPVNFSEEEKQEEGFLGEYLRVPAKFPVLIRRESKGEGLRKCSPT